MRSLKEETLKQLEEKCRSFEERAKDEKTQGKYLAFLKEFESRQ